MFRRSIKLQRVWRTFPVVGCAHMFLRRKLNGHLFRQCNIFVVDASRAWWTGPDWNEPPHLMTQAASEEFPGVRVISP
jgi:hypothetical protein